jgi:L-lactate dehydrogenase complex protein LldE
VRVFGGHDVVVSPSSSCVGTVRELYPRLLGEDVRVDHVLELSELLVGRLGLEDVGASFPHRVTYHPTCHSLRMLRVGDRPLQLLRAVRGIELVELPGAEECCGFGGTFSVKFAQISGAMARTKVDSIIKTGASHVVSLDSSCLMQLRGALSRGGHNVETVHLAEVLASRG